MDRRLEMFEEAVEPIRKLWTGEAVNWEGKLCRLDHARIYNVSETPPEICVSGFGPKAIVLAARIGDGFINTAPDAGAVKRFNDASGGKPAHAGAKVAAIAPTQGEDEEHARSLARYAVGRVLIELTTLARTDALRERPLAQAVGRPEARSKPLKWLTVCTSWG